MSTQLLSPESVKKLLENENVDFANSRNVRFTKEFKQFAYDELMRGKTIRQIFEESGLDVGILGIKRLENFRARLEERAQRQEGFEDQRKNNRRHEAENQELSLQRKIRQLEHQVAYLEQENDFLKKIQEVEKAFEIKAGGSTCKHK